MQLPRHPVFPSARAPPGPRGGSADRSRAAPEHAVYSPATSAPAASTDRRRASWGFSVDHTWVGLSPPALTLPPTLSDTQRTDVIRRLQSDIPQMILTQAMTGPQPPGRHTEVRVMQPTHTPGLALDGPSASQGWGAEGLGGPGADRSVNCVRGGVG